MRPIFGSSSLREAPLLRLTAAAALLGVAVFLQTGWFMEVFGSADPSQAAWRDWIQFHRTATRIVAGRAGEIYPDGFPPAGGRGEASDGFYFLYPPFVAWLTLPLALLSELGAYLVLAMAVAGGTIAACIGILRALGIGGVKRLFASLALVASAPWNVAVLLGHLSGWLLIPPWLALRAWARSSPVLMGAALSLFLSKPNWGLPIFALLICGRRWRILAGFLGGGAALFLISLPLGPGLWPDWLQAVAGYRPLVAEATLPWKQVTLFASFQSLLGRSGADPVVLALWGLSSVGIMGGTAWVWFRRGPSREDLPRLLGVGLLAVLATNPYAYLYDAVLLLPMGVILWTQGGGYRSHRLLNGARVVSIITYLWMHLQFFVFLDAGPSLTGLGLGIWAILELMDLIRSPRMPLRS